MSKRWEYLNLSWAYRAEKIEGVPPTPLERKLGADPAWIYSQEFYVRRPGATEPEEIFDGDSGAAPHFSSILNELGAEGWELVGFESSSNRVGKSLGWSEVGYPVARNWVFKRRAA
jgi:hypothetical protein